MNDPLEEAMRTIAAILVLSLVCVLALADEGADARVQKLEKRVKKLEDEVAAMKKQLAVLVLRDRVRQYIEARGIQINEELDTLQAMIDEAPEDADTTEQQTRIEALWAEAEAFDSVTGYVDLRPHLETRRDYLRARIASLKNQRDKAETDDAKAALSAQIKEEEARLAAVEELQKLGEDAGLGSTLLWHVDFDASMQGSPALGDLDGDGKLELIFGQKLETLCLNAADGNEKWRGPGDSGGGTACSVIADFDRDGKMEVVGYDTAGEALLCLGNDGKQKWKIAHRSGADMIPAAADLDGDGTLEVVIATRWSGRDVGAPQDDITRLCCYSTGSQSIKWTAEFTRNSLTEPMLADCNGDKVLDVVVAAWGNNSKIIAFDGKTGASLWTFDYPEGSTAVGAIRGLALSRGGDRIFAATMMGRVHAIDLKGKAVWEKQFDKESFQSPICVCDVDADGKEELLVQGKSLRVLKTANGDELFSRKLENELTYGGAVVADADGDGDSDIVFSDGCAVVAIDGKTGAESFRYDVETRNAGAETTSSTPLVGDFDGDGHLDVFVVVGRNAEKDPALNYGRAVAVRLGGKALPGGDWATYHGNNRRTGNLAHR